MTVGAVRALFAFCALMAAAPPVAAGPSGTPSGATLATACAGRDGWSDAAPPAHIFGTTYYVGTCGIAVLLIAGPKGHVLIDGATAEAVPGILANIRALGFSPRDVKLIIGSHEHVDHMGGFAALKAATGARLRVRAPARAVLESGRPDAGDPQSGMIPPLPPVRVDATLADNDVVRVGRTAVTAVATPGHTDGGTSWTWRACEGARCLTFAYVDSLTAVSREGYRFSDHPVRVARFEDSFARVERLPCDILVTPHPSASDLFARLGGAKPSVDADGCRRLVREMRVRLDARLAKERG
jgi:metallo-beta-lactamase class B